MINSDDAENRGTRVMAFAVPAAVALATKAAAARELTSLSDVCRRALVNDLRERGLLNLSIASGK
jgi:hypothetical protein